MNLSLYLSIFTSFPSLQSWNSNPGRHTSLWTTLIGTTALFIDLVLRAETVGINLTHCHTETFIFLLGPGNSGVKKFWQAQGWYLCKFPVSGCFCSVSAPQKKNTRSVSSLTYIWAGAWHVWETFWPRYLIFMQKTDSWFILVITVKGDKCRAWGFSRLNEPCFTLSRFPKCYPQHN